MTDRRLRAADAQSFWMSAKIPSDTFLVYGFDGAPTDVEQTLREIAARARDCVDLTVRIDDRRFLTYPRWVRRGVDDSQFVVHDLESRTWAGCLAAIADLIVVPLDSTVTAWQLHVFTDIEDVPGAAGTGTVAVLHITHALGGAARTSAHAAIMFGREGGTVAEIEVPPSGLFALPRAGFRAARAHRQLLEDVEAGKVPGPAEPHPVLRTNTAPTGPRLLRMLVRKRSELSGPTVTVSALSAVSAALAGHLRSIGDDPSTLGAEVPIAKPPPRLAYNYAGNVAVPLHPDLSEPDRGERIAADLGLRRQRAAHPAMRAADLAFAATPAPLLRWGVKQFDASIRASMVTGNTVVTSIKCGADDFGFGGAPVLFAAVFPALSPMMGLTHSVCGLGDTVTLNVHAADSALGDVDDYVERLEAAF